MTITFSRRLAVILGVLTPLAETVRRWRQLGDIGVLPFWLDDYFIGALLLYGAWRTGKDIRNGAFVIENSSWIRRLEQMNSAHPCHKPERFWARKHYVLSFHDSTFECVADDYTVELHDSSLNKILPRMMELLY